MSRDWSWSCWFFRVEGASRPADSASPEASPIESNPDQQVWLRDKARQDQERYRLRVVLPKSALDKAAALAPAPFGYNQQVPPAVGTSETGERGLLLGVLCLAGLFLLPRITRAVLGQFLPGFGISGGHTEESPDGLADEKAFGQFLVSFRAGPTPRLRPSRITDKKMVEPGAEVDLSRVQTDSALIQGILAAAPDQLLDMRNVLQAVRREPDESSQRNLLRELRIRLRSFSDRVSLPELLPIWQVSSVTEGLVGQLADRPRVVAPNALRTVAGAIDLLVEFCRRRPESQLSTLPPIRILVVDDDLISRHAVGLALKKAFNQPDLAANSEAALALASMIAYDVIFLDILMPGMNGFELCSKIRETPMNQFTPVVFVTIQNDFDARARSNLCGGSDFITKPFLTFEVTVRALVLALRGRLGNRAPKPASDPAPCYSEHR